MSVYAIHKLLWLSEEDSEFRARLQSDPEEAMKGFAFTAEEVQALRNGDVHTLHQWGVSNFLMRVMPMHGPVGMTNETYRERIGKESPRLQV